MLSASSELDPSVAQSNAVVDQYSATAEQEYLAPVQTELQSAPEMFLMEPAASSSTVGVDATAAGSSMGMFTGVLESASDGVATDSQQILGEAQTFETTTSTDSDSSVGTGTSDSGSTSLFGEDADLQSFANTLTSSAFGSFGAASGTSSISSTSSSTSTTSGTTSSGMSVFAGGGTSSPGGSSTSGSAVQSDESDELWVFDDAAVGTFVGRVVLRADGALATSYSIGALNDAASIFTGTFFSVDANGDVTTTALLAPLVGNEGYLVIQATSGAVTVDYSFLVTIVPQLSEPGYPDPPQILDTFTPSEVTPSGTVIGTASILVGGVVADVYSRADSSMAYDF